MVQTLDTALLLMVDQATTVVALIIGGDTSLMMAVRAGTGEHAVGEVTIIAPDNTGYTQIIADNLGFHTNGIVQYSKLYFARLSAADVDAIQLSPSAGNITGRYVFVGINKTVT